MILSQTRCICFSSSRSYCFFKTPGSTAIYTLSLHDALPISPDFRAVDEAHDPRREVVRLHVRDRRRDRKSTRLNSSHVEISYAVFSLKKKKENMAIVVLSPQDGVSRRQRRLVRS